MGKVSSGSCLPAGWMRQPLLRRNPPDGKGPTCWRGSGCDITNAASSGATRKANHFLMSFYCSRPHCEGPRSSVILSAAMPGMQLPARIGRYELEEYLGGGMSHVY